MAKLLEIVIHPSPILKKMSKPVVAAQISSTSIQKLIEDMILTMNKKNGIGLAAPQVGVSERLVIVNTADGPIALINPVITKKSVAMESGEEGCLSIPGVWGIVKRHKKIKVKALSFAA